MMPVARLRSPMVNVRLNERLAPFLALPDHQGGTWRLTTYQGRKTFSRFIGRRDRTGLTALQRHLGHVHPAMTDRASFGPDFALSLEDCRVGNAWVCTFTFGCSPCYITKKL